LRVAARFFQHAEQATAFVTLREYEAVFGAQHCYFHAAFAHQRDDLLVGKTAFETAREIDAPELEPVPAGITRGAQHVRKRCRIQGPRVQREALAHPVAHCFSSGTRIALNGDISGNAGDEVTKLGVAGIVRQRGSRERFS
jgi:hypothetical protein